MRLLIDHRPAIDLNEMPVDDEFREGYSPLHSIIGKKLYDIALLLLSTPGDRVDVHVIDSEDGRTVLHRVADDDTGEHTSRIAVIKALLDAGINKNVKDKDGKIAADYAAPRYIRDLINTYVPNDGVKTEVSSKKAVKSLELSSSSIVNVTTKSDTKSTNGEEKRVAKNGNALGKCSTNEKRAPIVSDSNNRRFPSTSRTVCKGCHSTEALVDVSFECFRVVYSGFADKTSAVQSRGCVREMP